MKRTVPDDAKLVFHGSIFDVYQWQQKLYDGSTMTFEHLKRVNTAQVIAVVDGKILIQEEEQPGMEPFFSLPGGRCDSYEEAMLDAAKRELIEETGYASDDWELWKEDNPATKITWTIGTFIARNCRKVQESHLDAGEKISSRLITLDEFLALAEHPKFRDVFLMPDLLLMKLHPERLLEFKRKLGLQ